MSRVAGGTSEEKEDGVNQPVQVVNEPGRTGSVQPNTQSSALAAITRSVFLYLGFLFRRPSKLFRPSRVDTWGGLRQLALSADQTLTPAFVRGLIRSKRGIIAVTLTIFPPLLVNATLGFLLFTSHSFFSLSLAKLSFFHPKPGSDSRAGAPSQRTDDEDEEEITLHNLITGPSFVPNHPTFLSGISGAGAGLIQGAAFTPVENVVKLLRDSTSSISALLIRTLRIPSHRPVVPIQSPLQALRAFLSSESWVKSPSWWTGWRWAMARDAVTYSVFFAAFDITRRVGLRVRVLSAGTHDGSWRDLITFTPTAAYEKGEETPASARVAQAVTIVSGGVLASISAEITSRPFRASQRILQAPLTIKHPIWHTVRTQGIKPFIRSEASLARIASESPMRRTVKRIGWRMAAVGPWGLGFLVWAWVGGEV